MDGIRIHRVGALVVGVVLALAGCTGGTEELWGVPDVGLEVGVDPVPEPSPEVTRPDPVVDPPVELRPDPVPDPEPEPVEDAPYDPMPDGRSGRLVPEGYDPTYYGPLSGEDIVVHSGWIMPAAFSGTVYELVMDEDVSSDSVTGVYQLAPGASHLLTSWMDSTPDAVDYGSICWTGLVFVAILPTPGVGLRLLAVDEYGTLVRPVEVLEASSSYVASVRGDSSFVFCPSSGPFIVERFGGTKIYQLDRDGTVAGGPISTDLPSFGMNHWSVPCTEAGTEGVCAMESGIMFVGRDGSYRHSDPLPGGAVACMAECDVAYTGDHVALLYPGGYGSGAVRVTYVLYAMDGSILVPPIMGDPVGSGPIGYHAASSGDTVLLVAQGEGEPSTTVPMTHLMDLLGTPLGYSHRIPTWRGAAVTWEGDAYGILWTVWPDIRVAYRRFLVED
jgi:hypothetical protein